MDGYLVLIEPAPIMYMPLFTSGKPWKPARSSGDTWHFSSGTTSPGASPVSMNPQFSV